MSDITKDAKCSNFHHGSVAKLDSVHQEPSGKEQLLKEMDKMQQQLAEIMGDDKLAISEKYAKTKELTELLNLVKNFVNINIDDGAKNEEQSITSTKLTSVLDEMEFEEQTRHVLLIQRDEFGNFYQFVNLRGEKIKYYYDNSSYKFDKKLETIEDIPNWFRALSRYLRSWKFDDITRINSDINIDKNEDEIIRQIICSSICGNMNDHEFDNKTGVECILYIKDLLRQDFDRITKDRMWDEIMIDEFCSDPDSIVKELTYMVNIEVWSHDDSDFIKMNSRFLNSKIRECLSDGLYMKLITNFSSGELKGNIKELATDRYIMAVRDTVKLNNKRFRQSRGLIRLEKKKCDNCGSYLHYAKNCKKRYRFSTYPYKNSSNQIDSSDQNGKLRLEGENAAEY